MVTVHSERERTYVADGVGDAFELPPLPVLLDGTDVVRPDGAAPVAEAEPVRQELAATYFDTDDLRLATGGLTVLRRTGGDDAGWHLQLSAGPSARSEVRLPLGRSTRTVPTGLQQMVWARSLGAPLRPVAEIVTDRTVRRLVDVTGRVVAEVADDRVTARRILPTEGIADAAGAARSWREFEVEAADDELLEAMDSHLRDRGLHEARSASTLTQVLDLQPGASQPSGTKLTVRSPAGDVVLDHLRAQVEQVATQDLPVRLDAPDAVHRMRVATRRLRSALTTFKPLFEKDVVRPLRGELKWLAAELGAARDAEVMRDRVRRAVESESATVEPGPAAAVADQDLSQSYRSAHDRVLDELDGERYHALLENLHALVTTPPLTKKAAARAGRVLPRLVGRSYTEVRRIVKKSENTPPGDEREELLHDARKAAKRARYAGESVSGTFGKDAVAFAEAMEGVQEALGEHQDSVLTRERLRELARHTTSTDAAFLYGRLHALEEARTLGSQQHVDAAWKKAGRKSLRRWMR